MVICVPGKMQFELSKERQVRKKKVRTWTEAAKLALELYPKTPMGHKDIFNVIRVKGLKDVSGPASLACLNAMLHVHSRGPEAMFYRVDGCTSVFGLSSNIPDGGVKMEVDEEDSGQEFEAGDSDQDSDASLALCGKKKVLYVRLPQGYKNFALSLNSGSLCNLPPEDRSNDPLTVKPLAHKNEYYTRVRRVNGENLDDTKKEKCNQASAANLNVTSPSKVSQSHSQRAIKHALRQQQKRRRRNTAIAASGSAPPPIPRIIMKSLPPAPSSTGCASEERWLCSLEKTSLRESTRHKPQTMRELLASIPGLSFKPRKRSNRKLSTAAQIAQTKKGCINIETPDSILVNTNLRALLNKHTFASLPALYQYRLVQYLPQADCMIGPDYSVRLTATALNNEFFARACQEWKRRLQEGEFTPENQMKLKGEAERDHNKLDPWKIHNFEPVWGHTSLSEMAVDPGKPPPFLMNSQLKNNQSQKKKQVPTLKIKPVVRRCRLSSRLAKRRQNMMSDHDSPSHSDENHPAADSPYYSKDLDHLPPAILGEDIYGPPTKKAKVSESSSESQESSEESLQAINQNSPSPSSVASTASPPHSVEDADTPKEAPSQSVVPPITIRSIPVKKNSGRNDSLERSYQICKAALESTSSSRKDQLYSSSAEDNNNQGCDSTSCLVTSSVVSSDYSQDSTSKSSLEASSDSPRLLLTTVRPNSVSSSTLLNTCSETPSNTPSDVEVESMEVIVEEGEGEEEGEEYDDVPVSMAADSTGIEDEEEEQYFTSCFVEKPHNSNYLTVC